MNEDDDNWDYDRALTAAGAKVICSEAFGSYQGDVWAKVEYQGKTGWIKFSYGSCSGCDAFQAEFHEKETPETLAAFGRTYLEDECILTYEEAIKGAKEYIEWDDEAPAMIAFIEKNKDA